MLPGPRRLFLYAFLGLILTAVLLAWAGVPAARGSAAGGWPALRMTLDAQGLLLHPETRVRYEYLRDARDRWLLLVRRGPDPAQVGDWLRYDGVRLVRYVQAEDVQPVVLAVGPELEPHPALAEGQVEAVNRLLAASEAVITGADPMLGRTATLVEHAYLRGGDMVLDKYWIDPSWSFVVRYEQWVGGRLTVALAVTRLERDPQLPEGFPEETP